MSIPGLDKDFQDFWRWVDSLVQQRWASTPRRPDVFQWIKKYYEENGRKFPVDITAEAAIIVMAGSDTVAAMLTYTTMHLACNSRVTERLQAEIDEYVACEGKDLKFEAVSLSKLPYLNAVISEVLRMHPPVPAALQRKPPTEGLWIEDMFVPADTIVQIPMNSVHRGEFIRVVRRGTRGADHPDSRSSSKPNEFIPERWTDEWGGLDPRLRQLYAFLK
jgi:cytochrome P450